MSHKELKRLQLIDRVVDGELRQTEVADLLDLSDRQVRRIVKRIQTEGPIGIVHRGRGRKSNNQLDERTKQKLLKLVRHRYAGFGPTLAAEEIEKREALKVGRETIRLLLRAEHLPYPCRRRRPHRQWRERKAHCGEMVQMDGSHHDWFEKRAPRCVLMGYVDDATGRVFARFYEYEGTIPALDSFRRYISQYGIPASVYLDRHGAYKSNARQTMEEQLNDREPMTQVARAMGELGVRVIHAHSPQAKGRVERLFGTFQDRLVKVMNLEKVSSIEEGNRFLEKYLTDYNRRFARPARAEADLHRANPGYQVLLRTLCIREERVVRNDSTIQYEGRMLLILDRTWAKKVIVEERLDGRRVVRTKDRELRYQEVKKAPVAAVEPDKGELRIGGVCLNVGVGTKGVKIERWPTPMGVVHEGHRTF